MRDGHMPDCPPDCPPGYAHDGSWTDVEWTDDGVIRARNRVSGREATIDLGELIEGFTGL